MTAWTKAALQTVALMTLLMIIGGAHLIAGDRTSGAVIMLATITIIITS